MLLIGLRRSGWRRSVDHDRRSLHMLSQDQVDHLKAQISPRLAVRGDASLVSRGVGPQWRPERSAGSGCPQRGDLVAMPPRDRPGARPH
jgi:hypothetical protein